MATLLASDSDFIPPIFVITEIAKKYNPKEKYDSKTGYPKLLGWEYGCVYFSSSNKKFEEKWFNEVFLKLLKSKVPQDKERLAQNLLGKKVILCSWRIESAKKKTYSKETLQNTKQHTTVADLSHLPPSMIVIGVHKVEETKTDKYDKKTGEKNLYEELVLLKCQWFNPKMSAFSEALIPASTLELLEDDYNEEEILQLKNAITENNFISFKRGKNQVFAKPLRVVFNHCEYWLEYEDMLAQESHEIKIDNLFTHNIVVKSKEFAPYLEGDISSKETATIADTLTLSIKNLLENGTYNYFLMNYTNRNGVRTTRTISKVKTANDTYFSAYCHLRKEDRIFKFDSVKYITNLPFFLE